MVAPLEDKEALEKNSVSLSLVISKPRKVTWMKGKEPLPAENANYKTSLEKDGLEHCLTIASISLDDSGVFTAEVDDAEYGAVTSTCTLTVTGVTFYYFAMYCVKLLLHVASHHITLLLIKITTDDISQSLLIRLYIIRLVFFFSCHEVHDPT